MEHNNNKVAVNLYEFPLFTGCVGMISSNELITNRRVAEMLAQKDRNHHIDDLEVILNQADAIRAMALLSGHSVYNGFIKATPEISGACENDEFDISSHSLRINYDDSAYLKKQYENAVFEIKERNPLGPVIFTVWDHYSCSVDDRLTPGDVLHIFGLNILIKSYNAFEKEVGIFFSHVQNPQKNIKVDDLISQDNNELIIRIPLLDSGDYQLRIITQFNGNLELLETPQNAIFKKVLSVV